MLIKRNQLDTPDQIKTEYLKLRNLYMGMVGSLYPQIVYKELLELQELYTVLGGKEHLPSIRPPKESGHVN